MAQAALPPGSVRRRTMFGLVDVDSWKWATIKATFWFLLVIFLQGYVPDRAYYLTVSPTVDLGFNAISPINLCPAENDRGARKLPCPAPAGAIIPWDASPPELGLPEGRTGALAYTSGSTLYLIGGETPSGATASVVQTTASEDGNLATWTEGPALPAPRTHATVLNLSGVPYVIGGLDANGQPTQTVYVGTVDEGNVTGWTEATDLALPVPLSDAVSTSTPSGLYLFGGRTPDGLSDKVWEAPIDATSNKVTTWTELTELVLPEPRADATAANTGGSVYILGGVGPDGVTDTVYYLGLDTKGNAVVNSKTERPFGWGVSVGQSASAALPAPRADATTFVNSGAIWVIGGRDANNAITNTAYWAVPNASDATISSWSMLDAINLLEPRSRASIAAVGSHVFLTGGGNDTGLLNSSLRGDLAPRTPFFRLGLFGITIPALSIKGEIGQQLGYIVAGSAALGNLFLLIGIGWMYSHRSESFRFFRR
ncbi:MAG: kelch repeat-containing protein, partial [Chloroflexota bacterium]